MPFARGAQAQDETERALGQRRLVGVRHNGGVKQRRGLRGVFVREVSADERLAFGGRLPGFAQVLTHLNETVAKELFHALMPISKFAQHLAQQPCDVLV